VSAMGAVRGKRQNKRVQPEPANPNELVRLAVRVPAHLRTKAQRNAVALDMSLAGYVEQLLAAAPALATPDPLPLAESA